MELTRMRRLAVCTLVVGALAPAGAGAALACHGGQHDNNGVKAASFTMRHHFGHQDGAARRRVELPRRVEGHDQG